MKISARDDMKRFGAGMSINTSIIISSETSLQTYLIFRSKRYCKYYIHHKYFHVGNRGKAT